MGKKPLYQAIATLTGTVIGAGILGIPFVIAKAGFWTGVINIVILGLVSMLLYLYLGETVLRTKGKHQLTGYAEKYLGQKGKLLMMFSMIFGIYGALVAYLIGVGQAAAAMFGGNAILYTLLFFIIVASLIYSGLRKVANAELYLLPFMLLVVALIAFLSYKHIDLINFTPLNIYALLVPYGVVLFAFLGATAIPEMQMELEKNAKYMKKAIIIGMLIPMITYLLFAVFIVGVTGLSTTQISTIGLGQAIGPHMIFIGNIFAVLSMTTSFLALGLALQQMYTFDYGLTKKLSWILTCVAPLIIVFSGFTTFSKALNISGIIAGGLTGVLIVLMAIKAKTMGNRKPEYEMPINWFIASLLIALFAGGAVYYLISIL